ncbi:SAM hydrolase/SAM-dependent halogenase family protein [Actinospongicola halichondriae]|uniref:SAM hydrolase/SAM-dependent halogenase family protein n=1 Tax=Actinospongicola halichondriae TaxID=3236844 RepID=UPI003D4F800A
MNLRYDTVSFLSDYGRTDEFVGVVHSLIRSTAPGVGIVDISHDVPRHDVRAGGLTLARSAQYLCPGVVLAVVDPGVGTARRALAIEVGDGQSVLLGPDNGLLAPAVAMVGGATRAVSLTNTEYHLPAPGPTFDGRDVFAPVAGALCMGADLGDMGEIVDPNSLTPGILPVAREDDGDLVAEVMWVDHFGNCQLNLDPDDLDGWGDTLQAQIGADQSDDEWRLLRRADNFAGIADGQIGLLIDSYGVLAIALDRRSAEVELGARTGTEIRLRRLDQDDQPTPGVTTSVELGARRGDDS